MPDDTPPTDRPVPRNEGLIPRPPSKEDVDQVSRDQALISDEWSNEAPADAPGPAKQG